MKVGISSWAYPWSVGVPGFLPQRPMLAMDLVVRAHQLGVRVVQFADNMPLHELDVGTRREVAVAARGWGIEVEVGTVGLHPAILAEYLRIAQDMESAIVRVVIDTPTTQPSTDEIVNTLSRVLPDYEKAGVRLLIENHDRFRAETLATILRAVDSPALGICLDTVNSLGSLEVVETVLRTLGPWVRNVHVKDFEIHRSNHMMGFTVEGVPAGAGRLDIPWLLGQVRALPHDANVILELWPPFEGDVASTVSKERAWVEKSVAYLLRALRET